MQIYEVGEADGVHFIAQEFVAGKSLDEILERQGTLDQGMVLDILRQVTSALCKAAEVGIVHRDIKPANILFSTSGAVKVADFGLARVLTVDSKTLTQVGVAMGTPLYMSPEQIEGRPVDARSDIYSLGVTSYHLLAGEPPHTGETALAIAVQHLNKQPVPLSRSCVATCRRALRNCPSHDGETAGRPLSNPSGVVDRTQRTWQRRLPREGWAAGSDQWSLVEWIAADGSRSEASAELGKLMREQTQLEAQAVELASCLDSGCSCAVAGVRHWLRAAAAIFACVVRNPRPFPVRDSPEAQLYHAKMVDSEPAWRAVWENFPEADPFLQATRPAGLGAALPVCFARIRQGVARSCAS